MYELCRDGEPFYLIFLIIITNNIFIDLVKVILKQNQINHTNQVKWYATSA